ncbi:MAG: glucosyl-3-phosphoglycerate synthase [Acidimicrobiales bacterium]
MIDRGLRSFSAAAFDLSTLLAAKAATGDTVSVCLPARNEAATVGSVVTAIRASLVDDARRDHGAPLVDEVVVVDDHSNDATAAVARSAGATVVDAATLLAHHGSGHGKGEALWKSVFASTGDVIAWVDADIVDFDPAFVIGMIGPLLTEGSIAFVKGHYRRPEVEGIGGGRVTELLARPLLSQFFPELAEVAQPLGGEYAGRRSLLEQLPFVVGYGVDVALLIDAFRIMGTSALAQADLGVRRHRNRSLEELGPQALAVSQAILDRAGIRPPGPAVLRRPGQAPLTVAFHERPPLASLVG